MFAHAASIIRIVRFLLTGFGSVGSVTSYQLIGVFWFQIKQCLISMSRAARVQNKLTYEQFLELNLKPASVGLPSLTLE